MRRLSSPRTYFYKRVFPKLWFGFLAAISITTTLSLIRSGRIIEALPFLVAPGFMAIVGVLLFRYVLGDLVDAVSLDGDTLVVENRGTSEVRIPLSDVINVDSDTGTNPRRVTVTLRHALPSGRTVKFIPDSPRSVFSAFRPDPVAAELVERVDALRRTNHPPR